MNTDKLNVLKSITPEQREAFLNYMTIADEYDNFSPMVCNDLNSLDSKVYDALDYFGLIPPGYTDDLDECDIIDDINDFLDNN